MLVPSLIAAASASLFAFLTYQPYQDHVKLHGVRLDSAGAEQRTSLNLGSCHSIFPRQLDTPASPAEASYCDDVNLHRQTGMAYFSCDPSRLTWDAKAALWDQQQGAEQGAIWAWDTTKHRHPRKMFISFPPAAAQPQAPADLRTAFHPLGIAVTVAHPFYLPDNLSTVNESDSTEVPALIVLVANHPRAHALGVVDVFIHDLDGIGDRDNTVLRWIKRIEGDALTGLDDGDEKAAIELNPFRLAVYEEQHSDSIVRAYPLPSHEHNPTQTDGSLSPAEFARRHVRIPSFFATSLPPPPTKRNSASGERQHSSSVFSTYNEYVRALLQTSRFKALDSPSDRVWLHHSSVSQTVPVRMDGGRVEAWTGFPPLLATWDGQGERGGSNTSANSLLVPRVDVNRAGFSEWEQHWVRGISFGITPHVVDVDADQTAKRRIHTYTPSFFSFWKRSTTFPLRAIAVDTIGRVWTAGTPNTLATERWIEHRRNEKRRQLGSTLYRPATSDFSKFTSTPRRPASQIDQTTFLYRPVTSAPLHPWDTKELARLKKEGIFVKKEFYAAPVFKQGAEGEAEIETRSKDEWKHRGFLPSVPTALAVDHERGFVLVVGAYEERGVAKCAIPEGWAEK